MKWLTLAWAITLGYLPSQNDSLFTTDAHRYGIEHENVLSVDLSLDAAILTYFHIYGSVETFTVASQDSFSLAPYRADYTAGIYWRFGMLDIGINHECDHGVSSNPTDETWFGMSETRFFLRISNKE